jgi:hypothetical protein
MELSCRWEQIQENESATIWQQEEHWKTNGAGVSAKGGGSSCSGLVVCRCRVVILELGSADCDSRWDVVAVSTRSWTSGYDKQANVKV